MMHATFSGPHGYLTVSLRKQGRAHFIETTGHLLAADGYCVRQTRYCEEFAPQAAAQTYGEECLRAAKLVSPRADKLG